jgi:hypothetical protein
MAIMMHKNALADILESVKTAEKKRGRCQLHAPVIAVMM